MQNDRPVNDPALRKALVEIRQVMKRYGFAGAVMLVGPQEAIYTYKLDAAWSGWRLDAFTPMGVQLRINSAEEGIQKAQEHAEGAIHTICQLSDFGSQTMDWMEQLKVMRREAGLDFDHTPFGGQPLPPLTKEPPA